MNNKMISEPFVLERPVYFREFNPPSSFFRDNRPVSVAVTMEYPGCFSVRQKYWPFGAIGVEVVIRDDANVGHGTLRYPNSEWARQYVAAFKRKFCGQKEGQEARNGPLLQPVPQ